ncbi:protein-tyrosine-phosphatase MKP1-like isoform X1 [Typha angustifolia]|uniref:protein-tyrosine-phosphatase MKP1-like isoform X1 n=1 Tax=Typha angustifolia TaxID=59011 RepID=UPI003C2F6600
MGGEEELAGGGLSGGRKTFWRSASWSSSRTSGVESSKEEEKSSSGNGKLRRCPAPPLTPRSMSSKARSSLPPLQPLAIARRSLDEWPKAGSDDLGEWPQPSTPSGKSERLKLDIPSIGAQGKKDQIAFFDKECSKVADHIYLGGDSVARNREILRKNGITHVLNCVGFVCPEYFKSDLVYKTLWLQDSPTEDITSILYDVFDYFEDVRGQRGRVFVHCCQGVSRSTSLVIAYLMWREGQSFDDAFQFVKAARGIANPNMGFACQLLQCQKRVHAIPLSPNSVLRIYRMAPHSPYDPLHLVPKLLNDPSPAALDSRGAFIVHVLSSIYVWIGNICHPVMARDAYDAAYQVVRYERVQGPIITVEEGEERSDFWDAFSSAPSDSDSAAETNKEQNELAVKTSAGKRNVNSYDRDFEVFYKAITGGVVPPFSSSGLGQETHLPARESNWSILRRKFISGTICRVHSDSALTRNMDPRVNRIQLLMAESSTSPPFLSPSSLSSESSSSSKSSSDSPSLSPSAVPSPTIMPTLASSNFSNHLPPSSRSPLQQASSLELLKPRSCSGRSPSSSIAERRGSFLPLKLPTLSKDFSISSRKACDDSSCSAERAEAVLDGSTDGQLPTGERFDSASSAERLPVVECLDELAVHSTFSDVDSRKHHATQDDQLLPCSNKPVDVRSETLSTTRLLVYRWPNMEKLATFTREDLDPRSVFLFLTPSTAKSGETGRMLYFWIGSGFEQPGGKTQSKSSKEVEEVTTINWHLMGRDFLDLVGLPKDLPVKVVKEQETDNLLELLNTTRCSL